MVNYLGTVLVAIMGGLVAQRFQLPAAGLLGSLVAVSAMNLVLGTHVPSFPSQSKFLLQICVGILLAASINRDVIASLRDLWRPALACAAIMVSTGIFSGLLISRWLGLEQLTALLGSAPGGISDMSLIAIDMGAQGPVVLVMHLTRLISVIVVVPLVVKFVLHIGAS